MPAASPTKLPAWKALRRLAKSAGDVTLRERFSEDADRAARFSLESGPLYFDFSRQHLDDEVFTALIDLAQARQVPDAIEAMFSGAVLNQSEQRAAAHVALRMPRDAELQIDGENVVPAVHAVLDRMFAFCDSVKTGAYRGFGNTRITDVVNIGIGGSDLGPRLVAEALRGAGRGDLKLHYVSGVDYSVLERQLDQLDPASTLFIVSSKSFTTRETLANARAARAWLTAGVGSEAAVAQHFVAVTANAAAAVEFGVSENTIFGMSDWVGGRYSLWSAVGLSVALTSGMQAFRGLLRGAHAMDRHFQSAAPAENLPLVAALVSLWNREFLGCATQSVIPYAQDLALLPQWLQQLVMESNGKSVMQDGRPVACDTAPIVFGGPGTDVQHAFFQALHQGTTVVPVDFVLVRDLGHGQVEHQRQLLANGIAQGEALMLGRGEDETHAYLKGRGFDAEQVEALTPHALFPGSRQSSTLLLPDLSPESIGALLAFYEHQTFVYATLTGINAFDQWGVEYGKVLADEIEPALRAGESGANGSGRRRSAKSAAAGRDDSTRQLIQRCTLPDPASE